MLLVRPLDELVLVIAVPFLDFADELLVASFDLLQVIIGEFALLLFEVTFELHPFPFELIRVHDGSSRVRHDVSVIYRSGLVIPPLARAHPMASSPPAV